MSSAKIKLPRRLPSEEPEIIEIIPAPAKKAKLPPLFDIDEEEDRDTGKKEKASRKRLTEEEKAARQAAKKAQSSQKKQSREEERAAKQAAKELEKALKKSAQEARKNEAPGNAIKFITVIMPDVVAAKFDDVCASLTASEIKYESVSNTILDNVITFRRDVAHKTLGNGMELQDVIRLEEEDNLIFLMYPEDYIPKIDHQINQRPNCMITYIQEIQSLFLDKKLTLFFMDFEKYVRKQKRNTNQDFRNLVLNDGTAGGQTTSKKKTKKPELPSISLNELNSAIAELQLITSVNYRVIKDGNELGLQLQQFAKAIAEAPHKRKKMEDSFDWYALSDSGNIKVDKEGNGLMALWIDQLMQFNNVGIDTAQAIARRYPSPRSLMQAYDNCETLEESLELLQDIPVRMGVGVLKRTRKVGPELSKRIYRFFMCTTGDRSLGSSHDT